MLANGHALLVGRMVDTETPRRSDGALRVRNQEVGGVNAGLSVEGGAMANLGFRILGGLHTRLYRVTGGKVGGRAGKAPVLLLTLRSNPRG